MASMFGARLGLWLLVGCASDPAAPVERAEATRAIAEWNAIALRTTAAGPFSPPQESRAMAMVSAAVYDAVSSIAGGYPPYVARVAARPGASPSAAAATAAHRVLRTLYPTVVAALDASYDSAMSRVAEGAPRNDGVAAGEAAAAAVLAKRATDHASARVEFVVRDENGLWRPTPPALVAALEPGWGQVTPFALDSGSQLRPAAPPALQSTAYTRDLEEIVAIGSATSTTRTTQQTEAARFWISTAPQLWNQIARELTTARDMAPAAAARVYLLLNVAGADAMIAAWDAKYAYRQWRPVTAIRRGAATDGPASGDSAWTPLIVTPPFPDYPAGHTAYAGAAETVMAALFGDQPGAFSITSPTANGATHHYASFREVGDEVVNARVWAGVHWRTSSTGGRELGRKVGDVVLRRTAPMR
jgi:hypothetical protein